MPPTISGAAATAESVLEAVMRVEPTVATMVSMFGGPVAAGAIGAIQPEVLFFAPLIENALKRIAGTNDISGQIDAVVALAKHLLPGFPNAPELSPTAPAPQPA